MPADRPSWQDLINRAQQHHDHHAIDTTHVGGVTWNQMPLPGRWHRCWAQSRGSLGPFRLVERCPCGATRLDGTGPWLGKHVRRRQGTGPAAGGENVGDTTPLLTHMRDGLKDGRHDRD